jgi:ABC-type antimicrobial peptide transport system permease subunit
MLSTIPNQVRLPLRVAVGVVAQGIRIRLGRSLVTVTGVVLGVAFLTSILTTQTLHRSVNTEDRLREQASRAFGFLTAETGPVFGKKLGVVLAAPLSPMEERLLARLERDGAAELRVYAPSGALPKSLTNNGRARRVRSERELGQDAVAILLMGRGVVPALDWSLATQGTRQRLVALGSERAMPALPSQVEGVALARPLPPDEQRRLLEAARRDRFRAIWIIGISLLVTIIGITNSMLMSVTERFRDIGTMKCLGAESGFIRRIFLIEASVMGLVGGVFGVLVGNLFALTLTLVTYGPTLLGQALVAELSALGLGGAVSLAVGALLSVLASLYPAEFAARMLPAAALRSNV